MGRESETRLSMWTGGSVCSANAEPALERYNYRNSIQGLYRMTKEEGFSSWGRGIVPNGARAVLMNMSQLAR